jgi:hypothetical protein
MKVLVEIELEDPHRTWDAGDEGKPNDAEIAESLEKYLPRIMFEADGNRDWGVRVKDAKVKMDIAYQTPTEGQEYGWSHPAPASKEEILGIIADAAEHVMQDDSFEGIIMWSMPVGSEEEAELADRDWRWGEADFALLARYRIGNAMGQGGIRMFAKPVKIPVKPDEAS